MISLVRLMNIQAYKDITFRFSNGVNVFEAPNETGKSIIFKVYRTMCDANWYGRGERKSLIRRGCEFGTALLIVPYSGGSFKIIFKLYPTFQLYYLFDGDEQIGSWKQDTIPKDIQDILYWYYDKESKILLNLCDQELDMPFVNSNGKFNYDVMKFIIESPELEKARFNVGNWLSDMSSELSTITMKKDAMMEVISDSKYVDTVELEESLTKRKDIVSKAEPLLNLLDTLNSLSELQKPDFNYIDSDFVENSLANADMLRSFGLVLQDAIQLKKPYLKYVDESRVDSCVAVSRTLSMLDIVLHELDTTISEQQLCILELYRALESKEKFEKENGVCPLCGSTFNNCEH